MSVHKKNLIFANAVAQILSKDPSTKVGAFLMDIEKDIPIAWGYNGLPRGMNDEDKSRLERPEKYFWFEHGERNAIFNAVRPVLSGSWIFTSRVPDMESIRALVSVGVKTIVVPKVVNLGHRESLLLKETRTNLLDLSKYSSARLEKYKKYMALVQQKGEIYKADPFSAAIIVEPKTFSSVSQGLDGLPFGMDESILDVVDKKDHSKLYETAEKNAIYNAARKILFGATAYSVFIPCVDCARAVLACGVKTVVSPQPTTTQEKDVRWKESFALTQKVFQECNVELVYESLEVDPVAPTSKK